MHSPFPGMDPYLETSALWPAVHNRLIVAIADALVDHLSEVYRVEIEKRTYFSSEDESLLVGIPDVAVVTGRKPESGTATATLPPLVQPTQVTVPLSEEVNERYLEIREVATSRVVTVIELLSPKNKQAGEGRLAYLRKRNQVLASLTHFVEIDLLRGGKPFPIVGAMPSDYRILICRGDRRPNGELYGFTVRQPIPTIPIPLLPGDEDVILDVQVCLNYIYERGRYSMAIDYTQPPQPAFSEDDRQWASALLQTSEANAE